MVYVYKHIRLDTNEVFYIGIGSDNNYKRSRSKKDRNRFWKNVSNKTQYSIDILYKGISWEEACKLEQELIKQYGRRDLGTGSLVNLTDGGEGTVGRVFSEEHKMKLRKPKKYVEDKKPGVSHKVKLILDNQTGIYYYGIKEAANAIGVNKTTLGYWLRGETPNKSSMMYV